MNKFISELRRREVFRTLGLYVGVCWVLIEAADVLLPAFNGPQWLMRAIIVTAVTGFPVAGVLAWFYNITWHGIERDREVPDQQVVPAGRKMDFVVIGLLTVALIFSVYLNLNRIPDATTVPEPVSLLIADFDNATGENIFTGLIEQALIIGIEAAPNVMAYDRNQAGAVAGELDHGVTGLPVPAARLVANREDIDLVLAGSINRAGHGYLIELRGLDPISGESEFTLSRSAPDRDKVLPAVGLLSVSVRQELNDSTLKRDGPVTNETFTAASIEAASEYIKGMQLAYEGDDEGSVGHFTAATELDPNFGRAYAAWAVSEIRLEHDARAEELWKKSFSLLDTMTERERLRSLGTYYVALSRNYQKAAETFSELVEKYPADAAGHNNLAIAAFQMLDFGQAYQQGSLVLDMFPNSNLFRSNLALYAMYAGDFDAAAAVAGKLIRVEPGYGVAYLTIAVSLLEKGDLEAARAAYHSMAAATLSTHRASMAVLGRADVSMYTGEFDRARMLLQEGISDDIKSDNNNAAAVKYIALAETRLAEVHPDLALTAAREALRLSQRDSVRVAAANILLQAGDPDTAVDIGAGLSRQLNAHSRAYALMIVALSAGDSGARMEAIQTLQQALELADLWRIRLALGRAYLEAGYFTEAFDEFDTCRKRRGEAAALFLDDAPTYRYLAALNYWLARAQDGLGMKTAAGENYRRFLELRPRGGPLAQDARGRLQAMGPDTADGAPPDASPVP